MLETSHGYLTAMGRTLLKWTQTACAGEGGSQPPDTFDTFTTHQNEHRHGRRIYMYIDGEKSIFKNLEQLA